MSLSDLSDPLDARDLPAAPAPTLRTIDRPTAPPLSAYVRSDLFAGAPESEKAADDVLQDGSAALGTRSVNANTPKGSEDADGTVVPEIATDGPGAAADANAGVAASSYIVRARIAGAHPVAYVAQGSDLQLVRVGDSVAGRRAIAIDLRGLALSDSTRLDLTKSYLATPASRVRGGSRIDAAIAQNHRLRAELGPRAANDGETVPAAGRASPTDMPAFTTTPGLSPPSYSANDI